MLSQITETDTDPDSDIDFCDIEISRNNKIGVFVSDVSSAIGLNRYRHAVSVVESMFCRLNHGYEYRTVYNDLIQEGHSQTQIGKTEERVSAFVKEYKELETLISVTVKTHVDNAVQEKVTINTSLTHLDKITDKVLQNASVSSKPASIQIVPIIPTTQTVQIPIQTTVSVEPIESIESLQPTVQIPEPTQPKEQPKPQKLTPENCETIREYIHQKAQCEYGSRMEEKTIQKVEKEKKTRVLSNNDQLYEKCILVTGNIKFFLQGRIDGLMNGKLIEVKNRKNRFMIPIPIYDLIQIHCYMYLLDHKEATLIEDLRISGQRKTKETQIIWDQTLWNRIESGLHKFLHKYLQFTKDTQAQRQLLLCANKTEKERFWGFYTQLQS